MGVRAKFRCNEAENNMVSMTAVVEDGSGNVENKEFFAATPNGQLTLYIVRDDVVSQFEVGKSYYLDLTAVEEG